MGISDTLKSFDSHSSVSKEFRVHTAQGAILSVVTLLTIMYLVVTEFFFNFEIVMQERVHVNATSPTGMEIEFDLTLHKVPCSRLQIDANDPTGQAQSLHLDQKHHIWKHRVMYDDVTKKVKILGDKEKLELGSTLIDEETLVVDLSKQFMAREKKGEEEVECGSCYGAGAEGECCDTCEDIKRAYRTKGWLFPKDMSGIPQCNGDDPAAVEGEGEGCNVHGIVALSTGGGNLHIAPGKDPPPMAGGGVNLFDMIMQSFTEWNVTHTVHKLRFGAEYPGAVNQLDDVTRYITDGHGMYQYYFQIVPTLFRYLNGTTIQTNQYSVTEHLRHVNPGSNRGLPGVFFFYEVSPLHVEITEGYRRGWIAFLTSICAVIGGVVTVMGLLDSYLFTRGNKSIGELAR